MTEEMRSLYTVSKAFCLERSCEDCEYQNDGLCIAEPGEEVLANG